MASPIDDYLSPEDQESLALILARITGYGHGEVRLVIERHKIKFIVESVSHATQGRCPDPEPPPASLAPGEASPKID